MAAVSSIYRLPRVASTRLDSLVVVVTMGMPAAHLYFRPDDASAAVWFLMLLGLLAVLWWGSSLPPEKSSFRHRLNMGTSQGTIVANFADTALRSSGDVGYFFAATTVLLAVLLALALVGSADSTLRVRPHSISIGRPWGSRVISLDDVVELGRAAPGHLDRPQQLRPTVVIRIRDTGGLAFPGRRQVKLNVPEAEADAFVDEVRGRMRAVGGPSLA